MSLKTFAGQEKAFRWSSGHQQRRLQFVREPKIGGVGEIIRKVLAAALHSEEEIVS